MVPSLAEATLAPASVVPTPCGPRAQPPGCLSAVRTAGDAIRGAQHASGHGLDAVARAACNRSRMRACIRCSAPTCSSTGGMACAAVADTRPHRISRGSWLNHHWMLLDLTAALTPSPNRSPTTQTLTRTPPPSPALLFPRLLAAATSSPSHSGAHRVTCRPPSRVVASAAMTAASSSSKAVVGRLPIRLSPNARPERSAFLPNDRGRFLAAAGPLPLPRGALTSHLGSGMAAGISRGSWLNHHWMLLDLTAALTPSPNRSPTTQTLTRTPPPSPALLFPRLLAAATSSPSHSGAHRVTCRPPSRVVASAAMTAASSSSKAVVGRLPIRLSPNARPERSAFLPNDRGRFLAAAGPLPLPRGALTSHLGSGMAAARSGMAAGTSPSLQRL
nr:putative uncharacterized protein ENSP00000383309 [Aegilops tauschii subsp. strangulata]